jgi:hypothetical protein
MVNLVLLSFLASGSSFQTDLKTLYYFDFNFETFQATGRREIQNAKYTVSSRTFAEVESILRRWESREHKSKIDERRIRLMMETRKGIIAVDAEGNLDIGGYGNVIPRDRLEMVSRILKSNGKYEKRNR